MIFSVPDSYFFVKGASEGYMPLNAFDGALLNSGIGNTNLVRMSSIIPPGAESIERPNLPPGSLLPVAYSSLTSTVKGQTISAAVAAAFPEDPSQPGLIMEYSAAGSRQETERVCRDMAGHGIEMRGHKVARFECVSVSHQVEKTGAVFAAVALWIRGLDS